MIGFRGEVPGFGWVGLVQGCEFLRFVPDYLQFSCARGLDTCDLNLDQQLDMICDERFGEYHSAG